MKKVYRIVTLVIVIMLLMMLANSIFAAKVDINSIKDNDNSIDDSGITTIGSYVLSGVTGVGIVVSVVMVAIIGVKYMMGSAEEKAKYKETMMPYLIGALLLFGASGIANAVVKLVS